MNTHRVVALLSGIALAVGWVSCQRKEYVLHEPETVTQRILFDWEGYDEIPPGMNLIFYRRDEGDGTPYKIQIPYDGGDVSLPNGVYDVVVYNDYTYHLEFGSLQDYRNATVSLPIYDRMPLASRQTAYCNVGEADILYIVPNQTMTFKGITDGNIITLRPELATLTLRLHVDVEGIQYVSQADMGIYGVASSLKLATGISADAAASKNILSAYTTEKGLEATTHVFLLDNPTTRTYQVELAFLLLDNTIKIDPKSYDVSQQVARALEDNGGKIPPQGIDVHVDGIAIDEVNPAGGGLSATIDTWGEDIVIPLE